MDEQQIRDELAKLEVELFEWSTGQRSHWNEVHGSVTGDYAGMFERAAAADAAEIAKVTAGVVGLRLLLEGVAA